MSADHTATATATKRAVEEIDDDGLPTSAESETAGQSKRARPTNPAADDAQTAAATEEQPNKTADTQPAAAAATAPSDEIVAAAPRLVAAIREPGKCAKVAEKMASLFEEGKVKLTNSVAVFDVLSAAMEDPSRLRQPKLRPAYRRLFRGACDRASLFPSHQQYQLQQWMLRVVTQIELFTNETEPFTRAVKDVRAKLLMLPCQDPSDEPPVAPGSWRQHFPERTRSGWCTAIFECLEVAAQKYEQPGGTWARSEVNMLVKSALERRQNFSPAQHEMLRKWDKQRKALIAQSSSVR